MKIQFSIIWLGVLFSIGKNYAQLDSIQKLDEVILTDVKLSDFSDGYKQQKLKDSVLLITSNTLTDILRFTSPIYFKEQGSGMVSSVSFRGTNASQTAVIWNGISINSVLTGQTDFNTLLPQGYDDVRIRFGGGSVQYGSGAVGGSVHLTNNIQFKKTNKQTLTVGYGSYDLLKSSFKSIFANQNSYLDVGIAFDHSDNDFTILKTGTKNNNGSYVRLSSFLNTGITYKNQTISFYTNYYYGNKNLASSLTTVSKDGYTDKNTRALLQHTYSASKWKATTRLAHLYEQYAYFPDTEKPLFFSGNAQTYIGSLNFNYHLSKKIKLNVLNEINYIKAGGTNIKRANRKTWASVLIWNHRLSKKLKYGINLRKEFLNNFKNPLLLAFDAAYLFTKKSSLFFNVSKNYRVPTFNDLYWLEGGNPNLQPETSYQGEIGTTFTYNNIGFGITTYYIKSKNLIKWVPQSNGIWQPLNISETKNYGGEFTLNYRKKIGDTHVLDGAIQYGFTKAIDLEKNKQLIYVPTHKVTGNITYTYKKIGALFQILKNGRVYTTTDNKESLAGYWVLNSQINYTIFKKQLLGLRVSNMLNTYYENVAFRPMANRNFQLFLNLTI
jgi:iron complex outermembrane receptor protein